ncbi:MAG: response regulator transcription factor [Alphaproteobacteria bacterium]|nr:response regulator transcription factor [Alphaproteobacteria bacterium]
MAEYRITIVDDHPLFRGALNQALSASMDAAFQEAGSLDELNEQLGVSKDVDLVLLDLNMPGVQGLSGLMFLRAQYPEIPVVVCSANEDPGTIRRCIEFGASGYIPKSQPIEQIREAVAKVLGGEVWTPPDVNLSGELDEETSDMLGRLSSLTPQQVRVLMMLGEGLLNKQIAYKLSVSEATIKAHVSAILQKLGVDSRTQAVIAISRIDNRDWQSAAN